MIVLGFAPANFFCDNGICFKGFKISSETNVFASCAINEILLFSISSTPE